jgi:hypothetical protein
MHKKNYLLLFMHLYVHACILINISYYMCPLQSVPASEVLNGHIPYMYACPYTHTAYIHTYACLYIHTYTHKYACIYAYTRTSSCTRQKVGQLLKWWMSTYHISVSMSFFTYIYVYIYIYIYIYIYTDTYICKYTCHMSQVPIRDRKWATFSSGEWAHPIHVCMSIHTQHIYIHMHTYTRIHTHAYIHTHTYTRTGTYTRQKVGQLLKWWMGASPVRWGSHFGSYGPSRYVCVCMYLYIRICIRICMYLCMYVYKVYTYTCMLAHPQFDGEVILDYMDPPGMYVCMHVCMFVCMYCRKSYVYTCMYVYASIHTHIRAIHIYT